MKNKSNSLLYIVAAIVVVIGLAVIGFVLLSGDSGENERVGTKEVVSIGGVKCTAKANIETYLIMGTDTVGKMKKRKEYDGTGQTDTLQLLVIDKEKDTIATVPINRDTLCKVHQVSDRGVDLGYSDLPISLASSTGDGLHESCGFVVEAIETLTGIKINGYVSTGLDAIGKINSFVDGVTVTIEDDFSKVDKSLKMGETIRLTDEQAVHFVHGRMKVADGTNENRMKRQQQYIDSLMPMLKEKTKENSNFIIDKFHYLQDYLITNLNDSMVNRIAKAYMKNKNLGTFNIKGTNSVNSYGYNEFKVNKNSMYKVIRTLYYDEIK